MAYLLFLLIFGCLNELCYGDVTNQRQEYPLAVVPTEETETDPDDSLVKPGLPPEKLTEVHNMAKNISHAKGIYREGGDKKDLRRSLLNKIRIASEADIMKEILKGFDEAEDKLKVLDQMEYMVHQYDVAISFANMGGIKTVAPLLFSDDDKMVNAVLLVLGSALQSNPTVQRIAKDLHFGRVLLYMLTHKPTTVLSRVVFALSSYLRNAPESQEEFFLENGITILAEILMNSYTETTTKLKILNLFNDLAVELKDAENMPQTNLLQLKLLKLFTSDMLKFEVCDIIASFLSFEDYDILLRTAECMLTLDEICHVAFKSKDIIFGIERLLNIYYPGKSSIDKEINTPLYNEILRLYGKVNDGNSEFQYYKKNEL